MLIILSAIPRDFDKLRDGVFDLLIIGGGSSGAGIALDAASRGFRVALVDKGDFASATSSASSKLVHGGLRYLEQGDFRLVHEALAERRPLLRHAPHLVRPLRFILPFYRNSRLPRLKARVGLWLYDILAGSHNLDRSRDLSALRLRKAFPALRARDLLGGAAYFNAQMDDARLGLAIVRSAIQHGACASNYVEATGFDLGREISVVELRDVLTGDKFSVRTRQVLNATGPWVDAVRRLAGEDASVVRNWSRPKEFISSSPVLPMRTAANNSAAKPHSLFCTHATAVFSSSCPGAGKRCSAPRTPFATNPLMR